MRDPLRVGVVGLGKIAQVMHLHYLDALPDVSVEAICDLSPSVMAHVRDRYQLPPSAACPDVSSLLQRDLDAVVVLTSDHAAIVGAALDAGLHVFVEKPLCWSLEQADALSAAAERAGTVVAVGYMKRSDPAVGAAAERLEELGPVLLARVHNFGGGRQRRERLYPVVKPADVPQAARDAAAGAVREEMTRAIGSDDPARIAMYRSLMELCSHDVNLAQALIGPVEAIEHATVATPAGQQVITAVTRHPGGARCTWEVAPLFDSPRDWDEEVAVHCAAGTMRLTFGNPFVRHLPTRLSVRSMTGDLAETEASTIASYESPFARQLTRFVAAVRDGDGGLPGIAEARADIAALIAMTRAAAVA